MSRGNIRRIWTWSCALAFWVALPGCSTKEVNGPDAAAGVVRLDGPRGLRQTVRIAPAQPATGDTLQVASVVVNGGSAAVAVESRICSLDFQGDLRLEDPFVRCQGYSMSGPLAAGDSLQLGDRRIVAAAPGTYTLRVRHLLDPEVWVETRLVVRR